MDQPLPSEAPILSTPSPDQLRSAFRELHADRLHGYALLLTLGDRRAAAEVAAEAIAAGVERGEELRHPERAAAWLRRRVLRRVPLYSRRSSDAPSPSGLDALGIDSATYAGLAALDLRERAALIGSRIEGLSQLDTAEIVEREGRKLNALLYRAWTRYAAAFSGARDAHGTDAGPIAEDVRNLAERALH